MAGSAAGEVMEKNGPEGVAAGSRRLYWNRTGGVEDSGDGSVEIGEELDGGADEGEIGSTETGVSEETSGNKKDRETEGEEDTVEEGEA